MMEDKDIAERNGQLIALITELDLGIHIIDLPHKPKLLSADYQWWLSGYVKNFHLLLKPQEYSEEIVADIRLKPIQNLNVEEIRNQFLDWMVNCTHKRIYTLSHNGLFLTGFNHHNKIMKTNPYPVFSRYDPITYMDLEKTKEIVERFDNYELKIN